MSHRYQRSILSVIVTTLLAGASFSSFAAPVAADAILAQDRAAKGNITEFGGARRMTQDQTEALKAALNNNQAKNVILFIGDGMGDSEITVARNYAEGAGGFLKVSMRYR
ncbi:putative alkaline phosphatase [Proteus penneri ATCC 35198]|nr:putative alkaline phosphatase [Proteus penneri ATCC 35198]